MGSFICHLIEKLLGCIFVPAFFNSNLILILDFQLCSDNFTGCRIYIYTG